MAGDVDAPRIGTGIAKMLMEPADGVAHLANDAVHPRFGRQGVFDDRHVETVRHGPRGPGAIHFFCLGRSFANKRLGCKRGSAPRGCRRGTGRAFHAAVRHRQAEMPAMPLTKARAARSLVGSFADAVLRRGCLGGIERVCERFEARWPNSRMAVRHADRVNGSRAALVKRTRLRGSPCWPGARS